MGSHLCQKVSIASDKTQSLVLQYRSIAISPQNPLFGRRNNLSPYISS